MGNFEEGIFLGLFIIIIIACITVVIAVDNKSDARRDACKEEAAPYQYKIIDSECFSLTEAGTWTPTKKESAK